MSDEPSYSARDLMEVADMSYRQLNEWDQKGVLPHHRDGSRGWRRFSPNQVFTLMVCRALQKRFGTPIPLLKLVISRMNEPDANYANWVSERVFSLGVGVWLVTDFQKTFFVDDEVGLAARIGDGLFSSTEPNGYAMLRVDTLLDLLTQRLGNEPLEMHGIGYKLIEEGYGVLSSSEQEVLRDIRSGNYRSVEVTLDGGDVRTIKKTASISPDADLEILLREQRYQRISIVRADGETVSVERQILSRPEAD
jgi:DNA-binding transcriptional MerR regulator